MANPTDGQKPARKKSVTGTLVARYNTPSELAAFYTNGATPTERAHIDRFLNRSPDRYAKEVRGYINYIRQSKTKPSQLERNLK